MSAHKWNVAMTNIQTALLALEGAYEDKDEPAAQAEIVGLREKIREMEMTIDAQQAENERLSASNQAAELEVWKIAAEANAYASDLETKRRVYYQGIVYSACNLLDRATGRSTAAGTGVCSGSVAHPSTEVLDVLEQVLQATPANQEQKINDLQHSREGFEEECNRLRYRIGRQIAHINDLQATLGERTRERKQLLKQLEQHNASACSNYWIWQGNGEDHRESLTCPVMIPAATLRGLVARPEALLATNKQWQQKCEAAMLLLDEERQYRKAWDILERRQWNVSRSAGDGSISIATPSDGTMVYNNAYTMPEAVLAADGCIADKHASSVPAAKADHLPKGDIE